MLLSAEANVNALDEERASRLFLACERGKTGFVGILLSRGANPNIATVFPYTCYPIYAACSRLHYEVVKLLLEYNADVNVRDESGETALHYAVSLHTTDGGKSSAMVQLLLDAGADANAPSEKGETPLYFACWMGLGSTVMKMLECGAKVDGISGKKLPLIAACRNEHVSVVRLLLANGANPNLPEEDNDSHHLCSLPPCGEKPNKSALVKASRVLNVELSDSLLRHGVRPNCASMSSDLDSKHKHPLFVAVDSANSDIVTALLNAGADVNAVNDDGKSVVCFATENVLKRGDFFSVRGEQSTVRLLLQHGADVNVRMPDGRPPLYLAVTALAEAGRLEPGYRTCVYANAGKTWSRAA